ncbi:MAG: pyridoxal-phosphate dependent enzyme [Myxococcota bacterium]|nr:pyridoxal-phosphate dependent enzyme [Myxococcota bacterium]
MTERQRVYNNILETIGDTPIVRLNRVTAGFHSEVYAKLEFMNPGGSVKDRIAQFMIEKAEERGEIQRGGTVVEGTSGNTGMGLAMAASIKGYQSIFVMPDKQSMEKVQALRAFGAKVVVTPTAVEPDDPRSYYSVSTRLGTETPNSFFASQYHNADNPQTHYEQTGPEIWRQMGGKIDVFIAGMGTGGTLTGVGKYLREQNPDITIVGVDPVGSIYYDYFKTGKVTEAYTYTLEGIGEDFLPATMDLDVLDDCVRVTDRECFLMTRDLVRKEGIFCGGSSGAAAIGALKWLKNNDVEGQQVLILLPDTGRQYLGKIFNDDWMKENGYLEEQATHGTVADLLGSSPRRKVIAASADDSLRDVAKLMKKHDVSQLPVMENGEVIGILTENKVLGTLLDHPGAAEDRARDLILISYSIVDLTTSVAVLSDMFTRVKMVLVMEGEEVVNVITKIDLIDYMSRAAT